jgi:hypothetical protein
MKSRGNWRKSFRSPMASACNELLDGRVFPPVFLTFTASSVIRSAKWLILNAARQARKIRD